MTVFKDGPHLIIDETVVIFRIMKVAGKGSGIPVKPVQHCPVTRVTTQTFHPPDAAPPRFHRATRTSLSEGRIIIT